MMISTSRTAISSSRISCSLAPGRFPVFRSVSRLPRCSGFENTEQPAMQLTDFGQARLADENFRSLQGKMAVPE